MEGPPAVAPQAAGTASAADAGHDRAAVELAVIVPTLNEVGNIEPLLARLERALAGIAWEVVFVDDDSRDGTGDLLRRLAAERPRVRALHRVGRRGLSSACIEGMQATAASVLAVIDADLQHDETLLPAMLAKLRGDPALDIVVASRFLASSQVDGLTAARDRLSRAGNWLSRRIARADLTDPLSGFFMLRRQTLDSVVRALSGKGFKILLDLFASAPRPLRYVELPMHFRPRHSGSSKLDTLVVLEFAMLLADKTVGRFIPVRFVMFVMVGLFGVLLHLSVLGLLFRGVGLAFGPSQVLATVFAMTCNFVLNNHFTYRDQRLRGARFLRGLASFYVACALGAFINYEVASRLFDLGMPWPAAGILGAATSSVWNYAIASTITWRPARGG